MKTSVTPMGPPQKVISLQISQPQLISIIVAVATSGLAMWYKGERSAEELVRLQNEIKEMRIDMKTNSTAQSDLRSTVSLMMFRLETNESDIRMLKGTETRKPK